MRVLPSTAPAYSAREHLDALRTEAAHATRAALDLLPETQAQLAARLDTARSRVSALVDPRSEHRLRIHEAAALPPVWLEPLGIGGHALLAHVDDTSVGCYECLFLDERGAETLTSSADFAAPGQVFTRDVTGCASVFTPYGSLDASRTAEVAARLAVEALSATSPVPTLRSWRGDPRAFTSRFVLSERWNRPDGSEHAFAHASCPVCRGAA